MWKYCKQAEVCSSRVTVTGPFTPEPGKPWDRQILRGEEERTCGVTKRSEDHRSSKALVQVNFKDKDLFYLSISKGWVLGTQRALLALAVHLKVADLLKTTAQVQVTSPKFTWKLRIYWKLLHKSKLHLPSYQNCLVSSLVTWQVTGLS